MLIILTNTTRVDGLVKASFDSSFNEKYAGYCFFGPHEMTLISVNEHRRSFLISIGLGSEEVIILGVAHIEDEQVLLCTGYSGVN